MTRRTPFGKRMRDTHFQFSPSYTPLNHGSFGAYPRIIQERQNELVRLAAERPDTFIVFDLPEYIDISREAVAPLLGSPVDEVVFVPNATTGINTVLRNLPFQENEVIIHFSTIYDACEKTIFSVGEHSPLTAVCVGLEYPIEDAEVLLRFRDMVQQVKAEGKIVKIAMFDTVLTFPGVRMPWEQLVDACKEMEILSLIDGAHGIGHIDLTHLGKVSPDFFVSNCHKWLYTPRGCAVFYVPVRNQHLIHTSLPTSHGYGYSYDKLPTPDGKTPFVHLFEFVATIDYTPYVCIPAALEFRKKICGGEENIMQYCWGLARNGGDRVAQILKTSVMDNRSGSLRNCCFANIELPLVFKPEGEELQKGEFSVAEAALMQKWLNATAVKEFDTYLQIAFMYGTMWVRLSGQSGITYIHSEPSPCRKYHDIYESMIWCTSALKPSEYCSNSSFVYNMASKACALCMRTLRRNPGSIARTQPRFSYAGTRSFTGQDIFRGELRDPDAKKKSSTSSTTPEQAETNASSAKSKVPLRLKAAQEIQKSTGASAETYTSYGSTEILYKECAKQATYSIPQAKDEDAEMPKTEDGEDLGIGEGWWLTEAGLKPTFSTWSQVTMLHMYLLVARFRCFDSYDAQKWQQHLIDHFFYDAENRMTINHGMYARGTRNKYLKDMFIQWRGLLAAYDEGIQKGDAVLAAAVWRNLFKANEEVDLRTLAQIVSYMRRYLKGFEKTEDNVFMSPGITFLSPAPESRIVETPSPTLGLPFEIKPDRKLPPGVEAKR
ncbi:hypothetical protein PVAG01_09327 [Phlyctema vagabunda]|uniref:Aminotransferase class V domain-containing protein n=1 Tax=Phlyctema vagabunda TaxID=108571 RepID=A0ABR4P704_9HELO